MNPLPVSIESTMSEIAANEAAKAILEKHCSVVTSNPQFKMALGMTLKQIRPMSGGKLTQEMIDSVAGELAQLPVTNECKSCGEVLPLPPAGGLAGPAGPAKP